VVLLVLCVCPIVCVVCTWLNVVCENWVPLCPVMSEGYVVSDVVLFCVLRLGVCSPYLCVCGCLLVFVVALP